MVQNILNQIAGLSGFEKDKLQKALFKDPANRDVYVMLYRGTKSSEGTGQFASNGVATTVITNLRSRILIADLALLRNAIFRNSANRAVFNSLFQFQENRTPPGGQ